MIQQSRTFQEKQRIIQDVVSNILVVVQGGWFVDGEVYENHYLRNGLAYYIQQNCIVKKDERMVEVSGPFFNSSIGTEVYFVSVIFCKISLNGEVVISFADVIYVYFKLAFYQLVHRFFTDVRA